MSKERYKVIPRTLCFVKNKNNILLIKYAERKGELYGYYNALGGHIEGGEEIIENAKKGDFGGDRYSPRENDFKRCGTYRKFF